MESAGQCVDENGNRAIVITRADLDQRVREWGLREETVEKDYVLGWALWGIGGDSELGAKWIFKGGTCLKKCYIETYRFSEDLDFTVIEGGPVAPDAVRVAIARIVVRIRDESGVDFGVQEPRFDKRSTEIQSTATLYYRGPRNAPGFSSIKLDLTSREPLVDLPVIRAIVHPYPDRSTSTPSEIRCYAFDELFAEKIRAMGERARPRDLYDIVHLYRRSDLRGRADRIRTIVEAKCGHKNIPVPTFATLDTEATKAELEATWEHMLAHQLPTLPPFAEFWRELPELFSWLEGKAVAAPLPVAPVQRGEDVSWAPPSTIAIWGAGIPLEALRFAAANRLIAKIGYVNEKGERTVRDIEPYSLRRTRKGHLLLHATDLMRGDHRAFRVDRIVSAEVTARPFQPRFSVELGASGSLYAPPSSPRAGIERRTAPTRSTQEYVVECSYCGRRFSRSTYSTALKAHKDKRGYPCSGRSGYLV